MELSPLFREASMRYPTTRHKFRRVLPEAFKPGALKAASPKQIKALYAGCAVSNVLYTYPDAGYRQSLQSSMVRIFVNLLDLEKQQQPLRAELAKLADLKNRYANDLVLNRQRRRELLRRAIQIKIQLNLVSENEMGDAQQAAKKRQLEAHLERITYSLVLLSGMKTVIEQQIKTTQKKYDLVNKKLDKVSMDLAALKKNLKNIEQEVTNISQGNYPYAQQLKHLIELYIPKAFGNKVSEHASFAPS
jgi:archaellum component FlaC